MRTEPGEDKNEDIDARGSVLGGNNTAADHNEYVENVVLSMNILHAQVLAEKAKPAAHARFAGIGS